MTLDRIRTETGTVEQDALYIIVFRIVRVQHRICNIWDILSSKAFTSDVDFLMM